MPAQPFHVEVLDRSATGVAGRPVQFPAGPGELETHLVEVGAGAEVGRHQHPGPCAMYVLEGQIEIVLDDGTRRTYDAGQAFVEDAGVWVNNRNPGDQPARFLAVVSGAPAADKVHFADAR